MVGSDMSSSTGKGGGALKATHVGDSLINNHDALPIAGGGAGPLVQFYTAPSMWSAASGDSLVTQWKLVRTLRLIGG